MLGMLGSKTSPRIKMVINPKTRPLTMCILFIARHLRRDYPLIIAANRDEFFTRPTDPLAPWPDAPILAGRDRQAGGTWLGINPTTGLFAAVTNIRAAHLPPTGGKSRGTLVTRALQTPPAKLPHFAAQLTAASTTYNPFNLLYGPLQNAGQHLYRHSSLQPHPTPIKDGITALSNGPPDQLWPKMARGTKLLRQYLETAPKIAPDPLIEIMRDHTRARPQDLPKNGIPATTEHPLSSIFIPPLTLKNHPYGTRTTTLLLCTPQKITIIEQTWTPNNTPGPRTTQTQKPPDKGGLGGLRGD
ncbi:MAG: NRDE family protein [Cellvibrionales bacterium]|nr:NRDE family protein [Cellvibrionales bacterium]